MRFILSDESVNRYGFRVLTRGIGLADFRTNPIMLLNHDRRVLPIGKWNNLTIDGEGRLMAEPEFDEGDELAMDIKRKCEKGFMNCTSIAFDILELSDDPALMVAGQKRSTVTKCELMEVSITDIGANRNAVKLSYPKYGLHWDGQQSESELNRLLPLALHSGQGLSGASYHDPKANWSLRDWETNDPAGLNCLLKTDQQKYIRLFEAQYGQVSGIAEHVAKLAREIHLPQVVEDRTQWTLRDWENKDPKGLIKLLADPGVRQALYPT